MPRIKSPAVFAENADNQAAPPEEKKQRDPKPTKVLPTNRMATSKQFDVLRAYGAASGPDGKTVTNLEVAKIVSLHNTTVGLIVPFFTDIGLLQKTTDGLVPSQEVLDFTGAYDWNPESAFSRIAPLLRDTWFFQRIAPKLRFGAMPRAQAVQELAIESNAAPSFKSQLDTLLDYLVEADLIKDEGGQLRLSQSTSNGGNGSTHEESSNITHQDSNPSTRHAPVATSFAAPTAGVVQFNIAVKVDMAELSGWQPERISAFFSGIAQVLAAKGNVERDTANVDV